MSPLALFYLLLAGSPVFNNFENTFEGASHYSPEWMHSAESSMYSPSWMHSAESSIFNNFETSTRFNTLLRKAIRNPWTSTRRSILAELSGVESPMFETESMLPIIRNIRNIRRIAEVNPIMIEKILSCPESRVAVEALLRHVEPETLLLVEKLIRKNIPTYLREKVARRVVKAIVRSTMEPRRSILSELYPTTFSHSNVESSLFESPIFESVFASEPKMVKILIEKLLRRSEVPEVVLAKIVRKIVKASISRRHHTELPFETLLTSSVFGRHHIVAEKIEKVAELKALLKNLRHESVYSTPSTWTIRRIAKLVKSIVSKKSFNKYSKYSKVEKLCRVCENVCESPRHFEEAVYPTELTFNTPVCRVCEEVCENSHIFSRHSESKVLRRLVKNSVFSPRHFEESPLSTVFAGRKTFAVEKMLNKIVKEAALFEQF